MNKEINKKVKKSKKSKKKIIFGSIFILILIWAGLTKVGIIPDFLNTNTKPWCLTGHAIKECSVFPGERYCDKWECVGDDYVMTDKKPIIYLYPQTTQNIKVKLDYDGKIIADYPKYNEKTKGWEVKAYPNGKIINKEDGQEYSYLFWEGESYNTVDWDLSKGFIVKGENSKDFLQKTLPKLGLTPKEYNEFVVYWYPILQKNKYNLIHFAGEKYTNHARLSTIPKADSVLRVFMVYKPLEKEIKIEEQKFEKFKRKGFVVVEWGGAIIE